MTRAIHLLLELPSALEPELPDKPVNQADLHRLLARSRLRVVTHETAKPTRPAASPATFGDDNMGPVKSLDEVERDYIVEILARSGGNRSLAARMLNISRRTLQRKMAQFA